MFMSRDCNVDQIVMSSINLRNNFIVMLLVVYITLQENSLAVNILFSYIITWSGLTGHDVWLPVKNS